MGVVERAVAAAEAGGTGDRALNIRAGPIDRALDGETLREPRGNRGGEGTTRPVGVTGYKPRALPNARALRRNEHVQYRIAREVAALDQYRPAAERQQALAGGPHRPNVADLIPRQYLGLGKVRGQHI